MERDYADVEKKFLLRPEKECRPTEVENGKKPDGKLRNDDSKGHDDDARKASSTQETRLVSHTKSIQIFPTEDNAVTREVAAKHSHLPCTFKYTVKNQNRMRPREVPEVQVKLSHRPKLRVTIQRAYSQKEGHVAPLNDMCASIPEISTKGKQTYDALIASKDSMSKQSTRLPHSTPTVMVRRRGMSKALSLR